MTHPAHPPLRITDPRFAYVPAFRTDVRETFARVRARMPVPGITVLEVAAPPPDLAGENAAGAPR
jgi:hypothetical protein